jgi:hypothetical protein
VAGDRRCHRRWRLAGSRVSLLSRKVTLRPALVFVDDECARGLDADRRRCGATRQGSPACRWRQMVTAGPDFDEGPDNGAQAALAVSHSVTVALGR